MDDSKALQPVPNDLPQPSPETLDKIEQIKRQTDLADGNAVLQFGAGAQRKLSDFADQALAEVRAKDARFVGDLLTELLLKVKAVDLSDLSEGGGFLSSLPIVGELFDKFKRFLAEYQTLSAQIEQLSGRLDQARVRLLGDNTLLDGLFEKNVEHFRDLELFIRAGEEKLAELRETTLPEMQSKAEGASDPIGIQRCRDLAQQVHRFEKRLHDLRLSRTVALQTLPQIRLVQAGNQELAQRIQSSILNAIPLWKNQIVIAISLFRQKKALELQQEVSDTTNELLRRNAELLKESAIEVAKESERGVVDVETLRKVNADLVTTIEEVIRIQREGQQRRRLAETELVRLEEGLREKLLPPGRP